ncbi:imm11 family protein [Moritella viscosa]
MDTEEFSADTEELATFSENLLSNDIMSQAFSSEGFLPISAINPIIWEAAGTDVMGIPDILDKGDRIISKVVMDAIMAWDPYAVVFLPAALKADDGLAKERYLLSVNNIIDVMDEEESFVFMKDLSDYDLPPELRVRRLFIDAEKYHVIPEHKKHIFRVKGSDDTIFFSMELVKHVWDIAMKADCQGIVYTPFDFDEEAPIM